LDLRINEFHIAQQKNSVKLRCSLVKHFTQSNKVYKAHKENISSKSLYTLLLATKKITSPEQQNATHGINSVKLHCSLVKKTNYC
jgi:hypothetical protein